jgi:hypothetical protein
VCEETNDCGELQVQVEITPTVDVTAADASATPDEIQSNFEEMEELLVKVNDIVVESTDLQDALAADGIDMNQEVALMPPRSVGSELYDLAESTGGFVVSPESSLTAIISPNTTTTPVPLLTPEAEDTRMVTMSVNFSCTGNEKVPDDLAFEIANAINNVFSQDGLQNPDSESFDLLFMTNVPETRCIFCSADGRVESTVAVDVQFITPLYQLLLAGELMVPLNNSFDNVTLHYQAAAEFGASQCGEVTESGSGTGNDLEEESDSETALDYIAKNTVQFFFTGAPSAMTYLQAEELKVSVIALLVEHTAITRDLIERVDLHNIDVASASAEGDQERRSRRNTPTAEAVLVASVDESTAANTLNALYSAGSLSASGYAVAALLGGSIVDQSTTTSTMSTTTIYDPENVDCVESQSLCTEACETYDQRDWSVTVAPVKNGRACKGPTDCKEGDDACSAIETRSGGIQAAFSSLSPGATAGIVVSALLLAVVAVAAVTMAKKNNDTMKVHPTTKDHELFPSGGVHDAHHPGARPSMSEIMPVKMQSAHGSRRKPSLPLPGRPSWGADLPSVPRIPAPGSLPPLGPGIQKQLSTGPPTFHLLQVDENGDEHA